MVYKDYLDAITRYYEQKKISNGLSPRLLNPSPAKLKDECLIVYQSRLLKKDLKILTDFLELPEGSDVLKTLKKSRDKFKPLDNFLRAGTEKPEDRHIELLGWLLNFEPRPFVVGHDYESDEKTTPQHNPPTGGTDVIDVTGTGVPSTGTVPASPRQVSKVSGFVQYIYGWLNRKRRGLRVGGVAVLGLATAIYFNHSSNEGSPYKSAFLDNKACMTWNGDYYIPISCDSQNTDIIKEPREESRLQNLHRITKPDTLTNEDVGKVWYRKRGNGRIDFYTAGGRDPVDPKGNLHPLSFYMFEKYLDKKKPLDSNDSK